VGNQNKGVMVTKKSLVRFADPIKSSFMFKTSLLGTLNKHAYSTVKFIGCGLQSNSFDLKRDKCF